MGMTPTPAEVESLKKRIAEMALEKGWDEDRQKRILDKALAYWKYWEEISYEYE